VMCLEVTSVNLLYLVHIVKCPIRDCNSSELLLRVIRSLQRSIRGSVVTSHDGGKSRKSTLFSVVYQIYWVRAKRSFIL
jgi:hypothetical protein